MNDDDETTDNDTPDEFLGGLGDATFADLGDEMTLRDLERVGDSRE
jgi:hypothetical protein